MKIFVVFLLGVFFTASFASSGRKSRALPLLVACALVAAALASYRSVG
jgi:hypothetical protein